MRIKAMYRYFMKIRKTDCYKTLKFGAHNQLPVIIINNKRCYIGYEE